MNSGQQIYYSACWFLYADPKLFSTAASRGLQKPFFFFGVGTCVSCRRHARFILCDFSRLLSLLQTYLYKLGRYDSNKMSSASTASLCLVRLRRRCRGERKTMRLSQDEALEIVFFMCLKNSEEEEEEKQSVDAESHKKMLIKCLFGFSARSSSPAAFLLVV